MYLIIYDFKQENYFMRNADQVFPIYKVEHDTLLSMQGELTIAFEVILPELFTMSNDEYFNLHQTWVKAVKLLPKNSIFHKQDWFVEAKHEANFSERTFLSHASERFFHERPYLAHRCLVMLTKRPENFKPVSSASSSLLRSRITPVETTSAELFRDFADSAGQFKRILEDSGLIKVTRLTDSELSVSLVTPGVLEQYCFLISADDEPIIKDIHFKDGLRIGDNSCQLYTMADAEHLPSLCGPRITYDQYSTDKTKFSTGFCQSDWCLVKLQSHLQSIYIY